MSPTHLFNSDWQTTYCGLDPKNAFRNTTTLVLVTCEHCYSALRLVEALRTVTPEQLTETEESTE